MVESIQTGTESNLQNIFELLSPEKHRAVLQNEETQFGWPKATLEEKKKGSPVHKHPAFTQGAL